MPTNGVRPANPDQSAAGGLCRIAVVGPDTRVDLAVPCGVPVATLLPTLLRHVGAAGAPDGGTHHGGWLLSTVDGRVLDPAGSLTISGVRDGDLLALRPARESPEPPLYDDVVELVGEWHETGTWSSRQTRLACGVFAAIAVVGAAAAFAASTGRTPGFLALTVAVVLLLIGAALSRAVGDLPAGTLAAALAVAPAAAGALRLFGGADAGPQLLVACAAALVTGVLGVLLVGAGDGVFAGIVLASGWALAATTVAVLTGAGSARAAAVAVPLATAALGVLVPLSLRLGGFTRPQLPRSAADLGEESGPVDVETVRAQVDRARNLFTGLVAGTYVVVAAGVVVLAVDGQLWTGLLATVCAVLGLLRARLFKRRGQITAAVAATAAVLATGIVLAALGSAGDTTVLTGVAAPALLVVAAGAALLGVLTGRRRPDPRWDRLVTVAETTLLLGVVPLVLGVWDVYRQLLGLVP